MLTKAQYCFLKDFVRKTKKNRKMDLQLRELNRAKINVSQMEKLLIAHPKLCLFGPYNNMYEEDEIKGTMLIEYIEIYLKEVGLSDCIERFASTYYGVTIIGIKAIEEFVVERTHKLRLPIISIAISLAAIAISIIVLCLNKGA